MSEATEPEVNPNSIFDSVKKALNILPGETSYDVDILMHINSCLSKLNQLGVGPDNPLVIHDSSDQWSQLYTDPKYGFIQTYIYLSVRLLFDPPSTTTMYEAFQKKIEELEWRLYILADEESG